MTSLSVNVNKFALLRNSRDTDSPNLRTMAARAIQAGAHGITVHPRPDQRHIRYADVPVLSELVRQHPGVEYNIEGNPTADFIRIVLENPPHQVTLVPDDPGQLTSDHGWDILKEHKRLLPIVEEFKERGIRVSLFMDAWLDQIDPVPMTGADRIELYTAPYADAFGTEREEAVWRRFDAAATRARELGLGVNAGHDLDLDNLPLFRTLPHLAEVSIGHALISRALFVGLDRVVREYLAVLKGDA